MKINNRTIIGTDYVIMVFSRNSGEENFAIELGSGYSLLLMDKGVSRPFWSLKRLSPSYSLDGAKTLVKGYSDSSLYLTMPGGGTLLLDPERVVVTDGMAFTVIPSGHKCPNCGGRMVYDGSDDFRRDHTWDGVSTIYHKCFACGAGAYVPGFTNERQDEAEEPIPEEQFCGEPLALTEVEGDEQ